MTLIIGGRCSGKYNELLKLGYTQKDIGNTFDCEVLYKLNDIVKLMLADGQNPMQMFESRLASGNLPKVVVCDEVGCGIVPMDKLDREYREAVGRICTRIAEVSDEVIRVYSGIAAKIK